VFKNWRGRDRDFAINFSPEVEPLSGAERPSWFKEGMNKGIAAFKLLVVLIGCEAKANIIVKPHTTSKCWFFMYPGLFGSKTQIEVNGNVGRNRNSHNGRSISEGDISNTKVASHIKV